MAFLSYAQNFEDVRLWRAFQHIQRGSYVDIGAQHPTIDSVSKAFYLHGWRGIHAEATPAYAAAIRADRPDELVIEAAIGTAEGPLTFYEIPDTGLSTGDPEIAEHHRQAGFKVTPISVAVAPLSQILDSLDVDEIHWMKIDVEGMERDVLESWGTSPVRPWILAIESTYPNSQRPTEADWIKLVLDRQYHEVSFDGLSRYFVSDAHPELDETFATPPNIFDDFCVAAHHFSARAIGTNFQQETIAYREALEESTATRLAEQQRQFQDREAELVQAMQQSSERLSLLDHEIALNQGTIAELQQQRNTISSTLDIEREQARRQLIELEHAAIAREASLTNERNQIQFRLDAQTVQLQALRDHANLLEQQRDALASNLETEREQARNQLLEHERASFARQAELATQERELLLQRERLAELQSQRDALQATLESERHRTHEQLNAEREHARAQLSECEKTALLHQIEMVGECSKLQGKLDLLEAELRVQHERIAETLAQREALARQLIAEQTLSAARLGENNSLRSRAEDLQKYADLRENTLTGERDKALARVGTLEAEIPALRTEVRVARDEQRLAAQEHATVREQLQVKLAERSAFWEARLSSLETQLGAAGDELGQLRRALEHARDELAQRREQSAATISLLQANLSHEEARASDLTSREESARHELQILREQMAREIALRESHVAQLQTSLDEHAAHVALLQTSLDERKAHVAGLQACLDEQMANAAEIAAREALALATAGELQQKLAQETEWRDNRLTEYTARLEAEEARAEDLLIRENAALAEIATTSQRLTDEIALRDARLAELSAELDRRETQLNEIVEREMKSRQAIAEMAERLSEADRLISMIRTHRKEIYGRNLTKFFDKFRRSDDAKLDQHLLSWHTSRVITTETGKWSIGNAEHGIMIHSRDPYQAANSFDELRALHDIDFVRCAYITLLGRHPDPEGEAYYTQRIRNGYSKLKILQQMRKSPEGKRYEHGIIGLDRAIAHYRNANLPFVGWIFRIFSDQEVHSRTEMWFRRLENEIAIATSGIQSAVKRSEQAEAATGQMQASLSTHEDIMSSCAEAITSARQDIEAMMGRSQSIEQLAEHILAKLTEQEAVAASTAENIGYAHLHIQTVAAQTNERVEAILERVERAEATSLRLLHNSEHLPETSGQLLAANERLQTILSAHVDAMASTAENIGYAHVHIQNAATETDQRVQAIRERIEHIEANIARTSPMTVEDILNIAS